jgi:hypothetical protein
VHGVFKHLNKSVVGGKLVEDDTEPKFFDQGKLDQLRARQVETCSTSTRWSSELFDVVPKNTYITITADHGELFGEGGLLRPWPDQPREGLRGPVRRRQDSITTTPLGLTVRPAADSWRRTPLKAKHRHALQRFHALVHGLSGAGKSTLANHVEKV